VWLGGGKLYQFLADTTLNQSVDILAHLYLAASLKLLNNINPLLEYIKTANYISNWPFL